MRGPVNLDLCVATSDPRAYFEIVSRLRKSGLSFRSILVNSNAGNCRLILTTSFEAGAIGEKAIPFENLSKDPGVFKGQILAVFSPSEDLLVGIDPGKRIGVAVFYGDSGLSRTTLSSIAATERYLKGFLSEVSVRKAVIRIGDGDPKMASQMSEALVGLLGQKALIEIVNEAGTSARDSHNKGLQSDQGAAARIAFRKGRAVVVDTPRSLP